MLDKKTIFEIHRLADQGVSIKKGASAVVIQQRLAEKGYDGGLSILKNHLKKVRGTRKKEKITMSHIERLKEKLAKLQPALIQMEEFGNGLR